VGEDEDTQAAQHGQAGHSDVGPTSPERKYRYDGSPDSSCLVTPAPRLYCASVRTLGA